jgi:hypothetical protein
MQVFQRSATYNHFQYLMPSYDLQPPDGLRKYLLQDQALQALNGLHFNDIHIIHGVVMRELAELRMCRIGSRT